MSKHYFALCRECSSIDIPEFREFKETKHEIECLHCGKVLLVDNGFAEEHKRLFPGLKEITEDYSLEEL